MYDKKRKERVMKWKYIHIRFQTKKGLNTVVDGISFSIEKGEICHL